ncbi:hypothetical protein C8R44DRAFT_788151 [Mycena epipterygia]|nr:hypothetical protein C8R44DRAFT_788151 [Mycena epipterygia]
MSSNEPPHGHILSKKSAYLERDTFIFITPRKIEAELFLGINQKMTPVTSATIHRWAEFMNDDFDTEEFFLCPVIVESAGIMRYRVEPSGPAIEPYSTEPLPPGNYGWYFNRECTWKGVPSLSMIRRRLYSFEAPFSDARSEARRLVRDPIPPALEASIVARDENRCRLTDSEQDVTLTWIIPPAIAWETNNFGRTRSWDATPFLVGANVLTMQKSFVLDFHTNKFTVDVDDNYRIVVLCPMGPRLLPRHLPRHPPSDPAADDFFRLHCRHSMNLMLRDGDISELYPPWAIQAKMDELGVAYIGCGDREDRRLLPFSDERWLTVLGKAIMEDLVTGRVIQSIHNASWRLQSGSTSPPVPLSRSPSPEGDWYGVERNEAVPSRPL